MIVRGDTLPSVSPMNTKLWLTAVCGMLLSGCQTTTAPLPRQTNDGKRIIHFSGYDWWVKHADQPRGPGPNYFSDSEKSVWVDAKGRLHLMIEKRAGRWVCAEVVMLESLGYGTSAFCLDSSVHGLDPNAVIGLFTWSDNPEQTHREIDVEIGRWGDPTNHLGQFVVQPYEQTGNMHRFPIGEDVLHATYSIDWGPDEIKFRAAGGRFPRLFRRDLGSWTYNGPDNPTPGDQNLRINFWLNRSRALQSNEPMELIVRRFTFTPLKR